MAFCWRGWNRENVCKKVWHYLLDALRMFWRFLDSSGLFGQSRLRFWQSISAQFLPASSSLGILPFGYLYLAAFHSLWQSQPRQVKQATRFQIGKCRKTNLQNSNWTLDTNVFHQSSKSILSLFGFCTEKPQYRLQRITFLRALLLNLLAFSGSCDICPICRVHRKRNNLRARWTLMADITCWN